MSEDTKVFRSMISPNLILWEKSKDFIFATSLCLFLAACGEREAQHNDNPSDIENNGDYYNQSFDFRLTDGSSSSNDETIPMPGALRLIIQDNSMGNTGLSIPGTGVWTTLSKKKNIAVCATSMAGDTACYPRGLVKSRCPGFERCSYENVSTNGAPIAVSVFLIKDFGRKFADRLLRGLELNEAAEANNNRAFWRVTFILSNEPLQQEAKFTLEAHARNAVKQLAFPGSVNPIDGPLSSPMEVCIGDEFVGWSCDPLREIGLSAETM